MGSEDLWRAALHDFNNLLTGLQGLVDLGDADLPFDPGTRARLGTLLEDGKELVSMARAMALGRLPYSEPIPWPDWEAGLRKRLEAAGALYRCPVILRDAGAGRASWPAPLLQDWAAAFTRQLLPWAAPGPLHLEAEATSEGWSLRWLTDAPLPSALEPAASADSPGSLAGFWLRGMAGHMGLAIETPGEAILVRMPYPDPSTPAFKEC